MKDPDVIVVGASIAGCTTAALLARLGAQVLLLEKRSNADAYKVLCTHTLQPCAMPVVDSLGLREPLTAAGAVPHVSNWWTRWGWIVPRSAPGGPELPHGLNMRRQTLDPLLRRFAADTPGVSLRLGHCVTGLIESGGRVAGVRARTADGRERELRARLVVGADGRDSAVGALSGLPRKETPNSRFGYWAYFTGLPAGPGTPTQIWFMDPHGAYCIPNDGGVTLVAATPGQEWLAAFREDLPSAYRRYVRGLPDGPAIDDAVQVSKIIGSTDLSLRSRYPYRPGLALVGDSALATDPLWGIGCAWAMQSAAWLADSVGAAVTGNGDLDAGLAAYGERRQTEIGAYQHMFEDYASGRPFSALEKLMFSASACDEATARHLYMFGSRLMSVQEFLAPPAIARAGLMSGWRSLGNALKRSRGPRSVPIRPLALGERQTAAR